MSRDGNKLPPYKHLDKIWESNNFLPYDDAHYAFFGFAFKGVNKLTAEAHSGLYNLGAFNEFGYGRFAERFVYDNIVGNLSAGLVMQQEFYGGAFGTMVCIIPPSSSLRRRFHTA